MSAWFLLPILYALYWGLGAALIKTFLPTAQILSLRFPHWFAAYFLGLVANAVLAFVLNQFFAVRLNLPLLLVVAGGLVVASVWFLKRHSSPHSNARSEDQHWSWSELALWGAIVAVWARRHALTQPLQDWDALMYHLPFGEMIRDGHFPSQIGRSYILQMEAAFPPLFYFQYGLNAFIHDPDITYLAPRLLAAIFNGLTCITIYHLGRRCLKLNACWVLFSVLCAVVVLDSVPTVQNLTTLYFTLAMYYSWDEFGAATTHERNRNHSFLIAALFWSGCYWNSYLGLALIVLYFLGLAAAGVWSYVRDRQAAIDCQRYAIAAGVIGLIIFPHLLRNWLVIGNPVYPALLDVIGGSDITEWYLANRPNAASPIDKDWRYLPISLFFAKPMAYIILAGATAALFRTSLIETRRIVLVVILAGFFVVWFQVFHLNSTPLGRYLYPVTPIALVTMALHMSAMWNQTSWRVVVTSVYLVGFSLLLIVTRSVPYGDLVPYAGLLVACIVLTMFGPPLIDELIRRMQQSNDNGSGHKNLSQQRGIRIYLCLVLIGFLLVLGWPLVRTLGVYWFISAGIMLALLAVVASRRGSTKLLKQPILFAILGLIGLSVFACHSDWQYSNRYKLPIEQDIQWLNANLSEEDTVLLFDGRLISLRRTYLPVDDYRVEAFDKAESPSAAMKELKRLGVTHFYFNQGSVHLLSRSFLLRKKFLVPYDGNPHVRQVYESTTGWIVELQ